MFQSKFSEIGFLFMHFSEAFEERHLKNSEIFLLMLLGITTNVGCNPCPFDTLLYCRPACQAERIAAQMRSRWPRTIAQLKRSVIYSLSVSSFLPYSSASNIIHSVLTH
jgi:hypothetical protein